MQLNTELWGRFDSQDVKDGPIESKGLSQEGIVDLLAGDDDKEEKPEVLDIEDKEEEKDEKEEEDKEEDKEDEDEDEEEKKEDEDEDKLDESELDLVAPYKKKEILKEFPNLDKKFPYLFHAYYGHQQFVEVFPTVEDAREASDKAQILDAFEKDVMSGSTEKVLKAIAQDERAFNKLVDDYLPALHRVNKEAATHIVTNVYKNAILQMAQHADETKDDELKEAVLRLNKFLFNTDKITLPQKLAKTDDTAEKTIAEERRQMAMQRFDEVQGDLQQRVDNSIRATIAANIDKQNSMSPFEKKHATEEAFGLLEKALLANKPFRGQMDQLWKAAFSSNYSRPSLERIKSAFFAKAKTVLPAVIKQARSEALKGKGRKKSSDDDTTDRRGHLPVGRHSSGGNRSKEDNKEGKKRGESTLDFFNRT